MPEDYESWTIRDDAPADAPPLDQRSPLKHLILDTIDSANGLTYAELAERLDMDPRRASMHLTEYRRQYLVQRADDSTPATYRLTDRGQARLRYFAVE